MQLPIITRREARAFAAANQEQHDETQSRLDDIERGLSLLALVAGFALGAALRVYFRNR